MYTRCTMNINRFRRDMSYTSVAPAIIDPGQYKSAWPPVTLPVEDVGLIGSSLDRPVEPAVLDSGFKMASDTKKSLANIIGRPTDLNPVSDTYAPYIIGGLLLAAWFWSR